MRGRRRSDRHAPTVLLAGVLCLLAVSVPVSVSVPASAGAPGRSQRSVPGSRSSRLEAALPALPAFPALPATPSEIELDLATPVDLPAVEPAAEPETEPAAPSGMAADFEAGAVKATGLVLTLGGPLAVGLGGVFTAAPGLDVGASLLIMQQQGGGGEYPGGVAGGGSVSGAFSGVAAGPARDTTALSLAGRWNPTPGLIVNAEYARVLEDGAWASELSARAETGPLSLEGYVSSVMPGFAGPPAELADGIAELTQGELAGTSLALARPSNGAGAQATYSTQLGRATLTGKVGVTGDIGTALDDVRLATVTELTASLSPVKLTYRVTEDSRRTVPAGVTPDPAGLVGYLVGPGLREPESGAGSSRTRSLMLDVDLATAAQLRAGYERVSSDYVMPVVQRTSGSKITGEVSAQVNRQTTLTGSMSLGRSVSLVPRSELSAQLGVRRELSESASLNLGLAYSSFRELENRVSSGSASVELDIKF